MLSNSPSEEEPHGDGRTSIGEFLDQPIVVMDWATTSSPSKEGGMPRRSIRGRDQDAQIESYWVMR